LAQPVVSLVDVPPMDNAQMDGFAVRCADVCEAGAFLPVSQQVAAGHRAGPLQDKTAARIFTGASLPAGADAVLMQEHAECVQQGSQTWVRILERPQPGQWIRRAGFDVRADTHVLSAGCLLGAAQLALAASAGVAKVDVWRRLRVALLCTGDELVEPGHALMPGQIYNANRFLLRALLTQLGCEVLDYGPVPDTLSDTEQALRDAAGHADLLLVSGGVSVGEHDLLRPAVQRLGQIDAWKVAMKPGKPLAFGSVLHVPFIALPGNPVSAFVCFLLFASPFIRVCQGMAVTAMQPLRLRADFAWPGNGQRREFLRVRRNEQGGLDLVPSQDSAALASAALADGLVDCAAGQAIGFGELVPYWPVADWMR
ncbi:MAG TPA: molybdopterin molybdotransferase MoeA, partial [Burkholderiaceae bacterium]|nr:molybdopterin molybdotransferase MoeA [Burkholderiaceae bacterium]